MAADVLGGWLFWMVLRASLAIVGMACLTHAPRRTFHVEIGGGYSGHVQVTGFRYNCGKVLIRTRYDALMFYVQSRLWLSLYKRVWASVD
jgi:hypothetical protein